MTRHDAIGGEMQIRRLTDADLDALLQGRVTDGHELNEIAEFALALRGLSRRPEQAESDFVARLAATARGEVEAAGTETGVLPVAEPETEVLPEMSPRTTRPRPLPPRLAIVARAAAALAMVPLLFAGLAFAGVTLPPPARDAFEGVGIHLPNQPREEQEGEKAGDSASEPGAGAAGDASKPAATEPPKQRGDETRSGGEGGRSASPPDDGRDASRGNGRGLGQQGLAPGQAKSGGGKKAQSPDLGKSGLKNGESAGKPSPQNPKPKPAKTKTDAGAEASAVEKPGTRGAKGPRREKTSTSTEP